MAYRTPPAGYADVGRSTPYGNPFRVGSPGMPTPGSTLPSYELYARGRLSREPRWLEPLRDKLLWCPGCGTSSPTCHARIIEKLLAETKAALDITSDRF